jgi:hypothetical protein
VAGQTGTMDAGDAGGGPGAGGRIAVGAGGATGAGGRGGSAGGGQGGPTAAGGKTGAGGSGSATGAAPTFTQVYTTILSAHCGGASCHNPGNQQGVTFTSQATAYKALQSYVSAGDATGSLLYLVVSTGAMPPTGPPLAAADVATIEGWINAGALNN